MAIPPKSDHRIALDAAAQAIGRHHDALRAAADLAAQPRPPVAYGFHAEAFERILRQPGCVGIRAYPALRENGQPTLVMVGVDENGNDMTAGELSDDSWECPPFCPPPSELTRAV